jgi:hypothetical protein
MTASVAPSPSIMAPTSLGSYAGTAVSDDDDDFSFHDLVSIVNPLQHLPVVSTVYRAVTGDTIKPFERIAGDTLYGGVWGFVSSVANIAFEQITGKDFGDTALALLEGKDDTADIATNGAPAQTTLASLSTMSGRAVAPATDLAATPAGGSVAVAAQATVSPAAASGPPASLQPKPVEATNSAAAAALVASMGNKGIDPALSQRALSAYRKSLATAPQPTPTS